MNSNSNSETETETGTETRPLPVCGAIILIAITCRIDFAAHWASTSSSSWPKAAAEKQQLAMTIKDMPYKWVLAFLPETKG